MKKIMIVAVLLMTASAVLFAGGGQSGSASSGGKTELTVQFGNWWEEKAPGMKAAFEAAFPQYSLKVDLLPINGYFDNAAVAILAGTAPEILDLDTTQISTFASRNLLTDLTQIVGTRLNRSDFITSTWDSGMFNGKLYAMPNRCAGGVML